MVLPSQSARPKSRNNHMYRGRRRKRTPMLVVLLTLLVVSFGVWRFFGRPSSMAADAAPAPDTVAAERPPASSASQESRNEAPRSMQSQSQPQPPPQADDRRPETQHQTIRMGQTPPITPPLATPSVSTPVQPETTVPRQPAAQAEPAPARTPVSERALERMRAGMDLIAANRPVEARRVLSQALETDGLDPANARRIREALTQLNERLIFSPEAVQGDPFAFTYTVRSGDALVRITSSQNSNVDWRFIQRINRISRPESIRVGQTLKLVRGPFHAVVHKRDFRMDIYIGEGAERVYVRSFPVGLGEYDSTPIGLFRVRPNSKLINPAWVNPRTGQSYHADDPMNPIGERWIGLEGVSEAVRDLGGYGIHGTIEPDSIGRQASMGCVRMLGPDVELVYELLVEEKSSVRIKE